MFLRISFICMLLFTTFYTNFSTEPEYSFDRYLHIEEIYEDLHKLVDRFGKRNTRVITLGKSTNSTDISGLLVNFVKQPRYEQKLVVVEAGIHAGKERITGAVAHYFIYELLTSPHKDMKYLLKKYNWFIIPLVNVDGYMLRHSEHHEEFEEVIGLWMKNMRGYEPPMEIELNSTLTFRNFSTCFGVDLMRNWDYKFNQYKTSPNICSDRYAGESPFSEKETLLLANFVKKTHPFGKPYIYISLHSGSQRMITIPFSDCERPTEFDLLDTVAKQTSKDVLHSLNLAYDAGNLCELAGKYSGYSIDWVIDKANVNYSFAVYMLDTASFDTPASSVISAGDEATLVIRKLVENVEKNSATYTVDFVKILLLVFMLSIFLNLS